MTTKRKRGRPKAKDKIIQLRIGVLQSTIKRFGYDFLQDHAKLSIENLNNTSV